MAEDNDLIREQLCRNLRDQGHEVVAASDGLEALMLVRTRPFDLVLTDIEMPHCERLPRPGGPQGRPRTVRDPRDRHLGARRADLDRPLHLGRGRGLPPQAVQQDHPARVDACLEKKRLRDRNECQRRRYEELLHAILPAPVVAELSLTNEVRPRRHEAAAVLFADIVGFTRYCDARKDRPEVVVQYLRRMFEAWEEIASGYGVLKIKTIGDAFMAACGLLEDVPNPVESCVLLGLRMIEFTQGLCDDEGNRLGFNLRVGVHVGPVIAGVLGRKQSLYDLWGDTVNTASRLESHGKPGCVNLSEEAWSRVSERFSPAESETLKLKGKDVPVRVFRIDPCLM
ncbi:MAG: adenylate/guanylate cyclase domain-containing protein [Isosphaeraceae bacterium]